MNLVLAVFWLACHCICYEYFPRFLYSDGVIGWPTVLLSFTWKTHAKHNFHWTWKDIQMLTNASGIHHIWDHQFYFSRFFQQITNTLPPLFNILTQTEIINITCQCNQIKELKLCNWIGFDNLNKKLFWNIFPFSYIISTW